jgi:hypothetical protein
MFPETASKITKLISNFVYDFLNKLCPVYSDKAILVSRQQASLDTRISQLIGEYQNEHHFYIFPT